MSKSIYKLFGLIMLFMALIGCEFLYPPQITEAYLPPVVNYPRIYASTSGGDYGDGEITGWIITNSNKKPDINDPRWTITSPYYDLPGYGAYTLYVYAKDNKNIISTPIPATVTYKARVQGKWTIMVWMDADNDLEPAAISDFNEIEYGLYLASQTDSGLVDKLTVIVQFDRVSSYDDDSHDGGSNWTDTRTYLMSPDPLVNTLDFRSAVVAAPGEINMGDANQLKNFIAYCKLNFPADHYALVMWNHGGGVRSITPSSGTTSSREICLDFSNSYDYLYTGELTDVLTDSEDVDVMAIDACFMGMAEVAYEYRPQAGKFEADFFAASPALEQYNGWKYNKVLARLGGSGVDAEGDPIYDTSTLTGGQLASILVKEYRDYIAGTTHVDETFVAVDSSKITAVKTALDNLANKIWLDTAAYKPAIEAIRGNYYNTPSLLHYFDENMDSAWRSQPHFDIYDFAERLANNAAITGVAKTAAQTLMTAVDDCVITSYTGSAYNGKAYNSQNPVDGKHGLGFFFTDGVYTIDVYTMNHYQYQWWYTAMDTNAWNSGFLYGKIDFCDSDLNGNVDTWRELLEYWYDVLGATPGGY